MSCYQPYSDEEEKRRREIFNRMFPRRPFPNPAESLGPQFDMSAQKIGEEVMQLWSVSFEKGKPGDTSYTSYYVAADSLEQARDIALDELTIINDGWVLSGASLLSDNLLMQK